MLNEKFWLAVAFFSFVAIIIKKFGPKIINLLDDKSKIIAQDIFLAKEARKNAEQILIQTKLIQEESIINANKLVEQADKETQALLINYQENLNNEIAHMLKMASERIQIEEQATIREIKIKILNKAINKIQEKTTINNDEHNKIIDKSIKNFERVH